MDTSRLEVTSLGSPDVGSAQAPATPSGLGMGEPVSHRSWTQARKAVLGALLELPCVVVILGAPGTGKTLLLGELARALTAAGAVPVRYSRGDLVPNADLRLGETASTRIVLVDEAGGMSDGVLEGLASQPRLGLVIARTDDPTENAAFKAAVGARRLSMVRLEPLGEAETRAFLVASLVASGRRADVMDATAFGRIAAYSGGVPRLINKLAGAALFIAASEGSGQVRAEHVEYAAEMSGLAASGDLGAIGPDLEGPADASGDAAAPLEVREVAPADLAAVAQSWADAPIRLQPSSQIAAGETTERTFSSVVSQLRLPAAHVASAPPMLRASQEGRIAASVTARARETRRRAALAAVLLLLCTAGAAGWFAFRDPSAPMVATARGARNTASGALPGVAVASLGAAPEASRAAAQPVRPGPSQPEASAPAPTPPAASASPGPPQSLARARPDASPPALASAPVAPPPEPDARARVAPPAPLASLRAAPVPSVAHARAAARPEPPRRRGEAEAARAPVLSRGSLEADRQSGALLDVLREYSAGNERTTARDTGARGGSYAASAPPSRPPQAATAGSYIGSYVMGPDGRRIFVQDP